MRSFLSIALLVSLVTAGPLASKESHHVKHQHKTAHKVAPAQHTPATAPVSPAAGPAGPAAGKLTPGVQHNPAPQVGDQTEPPAGAIVVDASGATPGSFKTVQAGVNALSNTTTAPQTLFIKGGTYKEQVFIKVNSPLKIMGETSDRSSYIANRVTITNNISRNTVPTNDLTATVRNWTPNCIMQNINIENTFGHTNVNGQNLALSAQAPNQGYYGCSISAFQDTILAQNGTQLYAKCKIVGVVDFIFGTKGKAWFEGVDIRTFGQGYITASGRDNATNDSWFVITKSTVAALNETVLTASTYLGRPWKAYARSVFQFTDLSDVVNPSGWSEWSPLQPNIADSFLAEYQNTGPGSVKTGRAAFAKQLDAPIAIETVLGPNWASASYVDHSYLSK